MNSVGPLIIEVDPVGALPAPDAIASQLLDKSGQDRPPVSLDRVCELWPDLSIVSEKLDGDGYLIDLGARGGEILIRAGANEARSRYTIAHELGHWALRTSADLSTQCNGVGARSAAVEKWCDLFAANLLMPTSWLRRDLTSAKMSGLPEALLQGPLTYKVSEQAFRLRISQITRVSIYEIRAGGSTIHVVASYESPRVRRDILTRAFNNLSFVDPRNTASHCFDSSTNFLALPVPCGSQTDDSQHYLLCLLPRKRAGSGP
jgi:hypothetical protein